LAEEAATWYRSTEHFANLVDFEEQIAALSTLILLIVESPGSMTELGAFSFVEVLRNKLYVVLEESYQDDHSFIVLGPIERLSERLSLIEAGTTPMSGSQNLRSRLSTRIAQKSRPS